MERIDLGSVPRRPAENEDRQLKIATPKAESEKRTARVPSSALPNRRTFTFLFSLFIFGSTAFADPVPERTEVIGPFTGHYAPLHPDNLAPLSIAYYGTDLGWTYEHAGKIQFLFGDTNSDESDTRIQASTGGLYDDAFGSIDLAQWPDPSKITPGNIPPIRLGQNPGTNETSAINPGHAMESFKTPIGGFSNGAREFGVFYTSKPRACRVDADCGAQLQCDTGLGFAGAPPNTDKGITVACVDGEAGCAPDTLTDAAGATVPGSGFCIDRTSSFYADTPPGRIGAVALKHLVGMRSTADPRLYSDTWEWLTNKFANAAVRTVRKFEPGAPAGADYAPAASPGGGARVFLWGRPGFIGVGTAGRPLGMYFAYADLPAGPGLPWTLRFYAGANPDASPRFSPDERDAVPADMDDTAPGAQPEEHDIVDQMSLSWVAPLRKWILFYGGGMGSVPTLPDLPLCGVLEFFARSDCTKVVIGNGPLRMRSADQPWGPWSPARDLVVGGDPAARPLEHQYRPGGVLFHPACKDPACVRQTKSHQVAPGDYGFLYGANIIEQWTRPAGTGVDILWNASTWNPYRVILLRTRVMPRGK